MAVSYPEILQKRVVSICLTKTEHQAADTAVGKQRNRRTDLAVFFGYIQGKTKTDLIMQIV